MVRYALACLLYAPSAGVYKYTWTWTKPDGDSFDSTASTSDDTNDKTLSGSDINQAGTYSLTCMVTDNVGNMATSDSSSFTVSYQTVTGSSGSGGGSSTASTVSFDVDFSAATSGTVKAQQGRVKSFSFDGSTQHTVTFDKVTATSVTITVASDPVTINLNVGETKVVDVNGDGISDVSLNLKAIVNGLAEIEISKIAEGAEIVAEEEMAAAGVEPGVGGEEPGAGVEPTTGSSAGLWITLLVIVAVILVGYFVYRKK